MHRKSHGGTVPNTLLASSVVQVTTCRRKPFGGKATKKQPGLRNTALNAARSQQSITHTDGCICVASFGFVKVWIKMHLNPSGSDPAYLHRGAEALLFSTH